MRLLAISDLHLASTANRAALEAVSPRPDDWLIVAGDVAERLETIESALSLLAERFARVIWVPGNHELWSRPGTGDPMGDARYRTLVDLARALDVTTPEDPYPIWPGTTPPGIDHLVIAPLFLLYDYSFRPAEIALDQVVAWAEETHNVCSDELFLASAPYPSRQSWCHARVAESAERLTAAVAGGAATILVNHWPLRHDLVRIPRVPRFTPWCGTTLTEDWHIRFRAHAVVTGHLHTRRTDTRNETRFEEVSLGYPRQWDQSRGIDGYLRTIL